MIHRDVWVTCDFCHDSEFAEGNVTDAEARKIVIQKGVKFRRVRHDGRSKDICEHCFKSKRHKS